MGLTRVTLKLGFIGFGIMGERLARAALAHDPSIVTVSGVFDPSPTAAARIKSVSPLMAVFSSAEAVIAASDALHIASPPDSHIGYLRQCHKAGKTMLCEKPLAVDVLAAQACVKDMVLGGARTAINFPFASSLAVEQLIAWIAGDAVGDPQRIDIDLAYQAWPRSWQRDAAGWLDGPAEGGFTREVASHFLFLSRRFYGPLRFVSGEATYPLAGKSERTIRADLLAGDVPVRLVGAVGTTDKDDHNTWTLTGTRGRVRLRDWSFAERETAQGWEGPPNPMANEKARPLVLARQLDKLAAKARGAPTTLATLEDALDVQIAVETLLRG
jgi:predicted dehydrogenase